MQERQLELIKTSIFKIDLKESNVAETVIPDVESDFFKYIRGSINEVSLANGGRKFKLRSTSTQVVNTINSVIQDSGLNFDNTIPSRLLREELKVQAKISRLGIEISEGILITSFIVDRGVKKIVICKVEDLQYIDKIDLRLNSGYPLKRKIFRSVQFILNDSKAIVDITVHDLSSKGATYWWDEFLEIDQLWDDIYNTKTAFNIIDTKVLSKIKKESPADHTYLRNSAIRYFRTNQEFTIEKFIETCLEGYQPVAAGKVDVESLKEAVRKLPEKFSFDERFNLKPSEITAKIKYAINLTENIDLVIKDEINIESTITAVLHHQRKYIRIRSDAGYDAFNKTTN
ncbi:MAG: hypothetical protein ABIN91_17680 [Mucilaginibacter sp.]|uniref:hypothetical protein n=1 Tax=Mucilaginibacter sp. TaxID=1882438 RepID=UPI0032635BE6